jgi:splicing factor U2AF subunit
MFIRAKTPPKKWTLFNDTLDPSQLYQAYEKTGPCSLSPSHTRSSENPASTRSIKSHRKSCPFSMTTPDTSQLCQAYEKTGACPKGDLCHQSHRTIPMSRCVVLHHIYPDPDLFIDQLPPGVFSISDEQRQFLIDAFYLDAFLLLRHFGVLDDMVLCGNRADHLSGNLIVMYKEVGSAAAAALALNNQFYAGRQITVTLAPVLRLSNAICRGAADGQCQMGVNCIFAHPLNPSKHVMSETFPRGPRAYGGPFRKSNIHRIPDKPSDLLYGHTATKREDD